MTHRKDLVLFFVSIATLLTACGDPAPSGSSETTPEVILYDEDMASRDMGGQTTPLEDMNSEAPDAAPDAARIFKITLPAARLRDLPEAEAGGSRSDK